MVLLILGASVCRPKLVDAQQGCSGVISAVSQEGRKVQWNMLKNSAQGLYSGKKIILFAEYEEDVKGKAIKVYFYKKNVSCEGNDWLTEDELNEISNWKEFSQLEFTKNQSVIVYFKSVDSSGNTEYCNTGILTIDTNKPIIEDFSTNVEKTSDCRNGIFSCDVPMVISVMDPMIGMSYSGIKTIRYQVCNMGVETQQGVLYDASEQYSETECVLKNWKGKFVVDSQLNNSNDVKVVIQVLDFAGNVTVKSMKLKIDISRPVIQVFYDNNQAQNEIYFSESRTATISIFERNFKPEDVLIQIENSEGMIPPILDWKKTEGSGNLDNTKWTMVIPYTEEGDYTFNIRYCDLAGNFYQEINYGTSVSPIKFTIDKTKPVIQVRYDNDDIKNEKYYSKERTAILEIKEHNLNIEDVIISLSADFGEEQNEIPKVQEWHRDGDVYTTRIFYVEDGIYTFQIDVMDKAGNRAVDYEKEIFCIDKTFPSVEISGVENQTSNSGEVCLDIVCMDKNYIEEQICIEIKKYRGEEDNREEVGNLLCEKIYLKSGIHYVYSDFPQELDADGIYELQVKMTDKAENCTEKVIRFSVNRFGSSYELGKEIQEINYSYLHIPVDLVVKETNVDKLISKKVILFKNGQVLLLEEGNDYLVEELNVDGAYQYRYTILKDNFQEDGSYQVFISSKDEAGNFSSINDTREWEEICFGIDNIKPTLVVYNLENGEVYEADSWTVKMSVKDNFNLQKIQVYLDNKICKTWSGDGLKKIEGNNGEFLFEILGESMLAHCVKIVCIDEAGNECVEEIDGFYVTTNRWIYLWKNKIWIVSVLLLNVLIGAIFYRIVQKKRINTLSNSGK